MSGIKEEVMVKSDNLFSFCLQTSFNQDFTPSAVEGNSDSSYLEQIKIIQNNIKICINNSDRLGFYFISYKFTFNK